MLKIILMHEKIFICNEREYLQAAKQMKDTNKQANKYQACLNISTTSTKKKAYLSTSLLFTLLYSRITYAIREP